MRQNTYYCNAPYSRCIKVRRSLKLIQVNVYTTGFSGERHWEMDRALPQQLNISVNINVLEINHRSDGSLEAPFIFTVTFTPPIAQLNIRGRARITGDPNETKNIMDEQQAKKPPPVQLLQAISNVTLADSILLCRSLNIPPPLPPIPQPQAPSPTKKPDSRYTA